MNTGDDVDPDSQLAAFRKQARALGFDDSDDVDNEIESADEFIARMKARDQVAAASASPRRSRTRWLVTGAVAAAAAVLAAALVFQPNDSPVAADTPPGLDFEFSSAVRIAYAPGEAPENTLTMLATAAGSDPDKSGSGPVQHHVSDNWYSDQDDNGNSTITPRVTETWLEPNGQLTTRDAIGQQLSPDGRGVPTDGPSYATKPTTSTLPAGSVDTAFVESLSRSPGKLRDQLLNHADCSEKAEPSDARSFCLYTEVSELFTTYVIPPDLARAVWTMLKGETGFASLGSVEDRAGRNGVGISLIPNQRPQYRFVLIVSTDTGQLLGSEQILIKNDPDVDVKPPAVISFSTITTANRVAAAPGG